MKIKQKYKKFLLWGFVILLTLGVFWLTLTLSEPSPPDHVTIATGSLTGAYTEFGQQLSQKLEQDFSLQVTLTSSQGSVDNLKLLVEKTVDLAFVQGGVLSALGQEIDTSDLRAIGRIYSEPLWVFYQGSEKVSLLKDFKSPNSLLRISIGTEGSGTQVIARELLRVNGFKEESAIFLKLSPEKALEAFQNNEIDVLFLVSSLQSDILQTMLHNQQARLMNFKNHAAYGKRLSYLSALKIEQGLLSLEKNLPAQEIVLLAPSATLVTRKEMHPRIVEIFSKVATQIFQKGNLLDLAGEFPSSKNLELAQHKAAKRYMEEGESWLSRNFPFWLVRLISKLKLFLIPLVAVLLPAIKILPFLLRLGVYRRIQKHYETLRDIERNIHAAKQEKDIQNQQKKLDDLEKEIAEITKNFSGPFQEKVYHFKLHMHLVETKAKERLIKLQNPS